MRIVWAAALVVALLLLAAALAAGGKPRSGETLRTAREWQLVPEFAIIAFIAAIMLYSTFE